ncbi:rhomboid family intramembrane serine protease [Candidatus Woesearchaeota archaeon]|nr:rhomboid family intramembrane serine protease [Candidatus Woesearchaeota archaeon]
MQTRINRVKSRKLSITTILLLLNTFVFILQLAVPKLFTNLSLTSGQTLTHPWTIFTSMFMHAGFSHLLFNMYALLIFGSLIEQKIGRNRFLWSYLLSGVVAALSFDFYNQIMGTAGSAVGASGAIMGILGLTIMLLPQLRVAFFFVIPMSMRTAGIIFALIDLFGLFNPASGIAHIAHLGGLAVGLLLGYYFIRKKVGFQKQFIRVNISSKPKPKNNPADSNYEKTIELTQEDIDGYFKYGKI